MPDPLIYVVDDEHTMADLIQLCLTQHGYVVRTFLDPDEAIQAFTAANPRPKLLIFDYRMPHMNGFELLRQCRAQEPSLKAICLSGHASGNLSQRMWDTDEVQPDVLLWKPFEWVELLSTAAALLSV